jgi:hypothetical protein
MSAYTRADRRVEHWVVSKALLWVEEWAAY